MRRHGLKLFKRLWALRYYYIRWSTSWGRDCRGSTAWGGSWWDCRMHWDRTRWDVGIRLTLLNGWVTALSQSTGGYRGRGLRNRRGSGEWGIIRVWIVLLGILSSELIIVVRKRARQICYSCLTRKWRWSCEWWYRNGIRHMARRWWRCGIPLHATQLMLGGNLENKTLVLKILKPPRKKATRYYSTYKLKKKKKKEEEKETKPKTRPNWQIRREVPEKLDNNEDASWRAGICGRIIPK